jgi:AAA family ATP:ADP antiporter
MNSSHLINEGYDKLKTLYLAIAHGAIIAAYSIIRPLKSTVFLSFVGSSFLPSAKIVSFIMAPILMIMYSKLLNASHRHKVAIILFGIYAAAIAIFSIVMINPSMGLSNTITSPSRITGWIVYLFLDFFNVMVLESFWSFTNSISSPHFASEKYSIIAAAARIAGIISPLIGWVSMEHLETITSAPLLCILSSILLIIAMLSLQQITKSIPEDHLGGYNKDSEPSIKDPNKKSNWLDSLKLLIKEPYVGGIFILVYSFNFVSTFADFQMQTFVSEYCNNQFREIAIFMFKFTAVFQVLGYFFSKVGTHSLLKRFGLPFCLLVSPFITFGLLLVLISFKSLMIATLTMIVFRALNYGFNVPVREMLFIPTTETIQFKSKAWISSFGQTFSEGLSSFLNDPSMLIHILPNSVGSSPFLIQTISSLTSVRSSIALLLTGAWFFTAYLLGQKYDYTIKHNKVIGKHGEKKAL